jgi:hypothetical protein
MELTFNKVGNNWVTEFTVTADFNIHIEKEKGSLVVKQSTVEGGMYDTVKSLSVAHTDTTIDADVTALVYPKYIRIESRTEKAPYAIVSSEGDVTLIENVLNTPI